jgi:hypothetical protein
MCEEERERLVTATSTRGQFERQLRSICLVMLPLFVGLTLVPGAASAQDMEPRAYSNAPVGMNFLVLTYGRSVGNVVADATLPVEDVEAEIHSSALAYARAMNFFGRSGKVALIVPYA